MRAQILNFLNNFKNKPIRKLTAFFVLLIFNFNLFSEIIPDPASIGNARATRIASGIDQLDIATPNAKGLSYNSLKELRVSEQGLILNNNSVQWIQSTGQEQKHIAAEEALEGDGQRQRTG